MKNQKREKLNLELKDMNYIEEPFTSVRELFTVDRRYTYVFKSGHKLTIFPDPLGTYWYGELDAPNGSFDAIYRRRTPEEVLDYFKWKYENNRVYIPAIKGFQE